MNSHTPWLIVAAGLHFRGGMDKANAELAAYLLDQGTPVHIVAHDVDSLLLNDSRATVHLVSRPARSFALGEFGLDRKGREVARALTAAHPGTRVVVNGGNCLWADINWVHYVHHAWTDIDPAAPAWFRVKHRLFSRQWRRTEKRAIQGARIVVANSELTRRHISDLLGVSADRVRTVYLGSDPSWGTVTAAERQAARRWLQIDEERPLVAFVGALGRDRRKGFDTLWKAWVELCRRPGWDADLVVAGGGGDAAGFGAQASAAGLSSRVRILGHTTRVRDLLAATDLLVSPVRYESYGLNVQEAICRGVPAIVSRTAGVAERYPADLQELLLDDANDVGGLVRRLVVWHRNRDAWRARVEPLSRQLLAYSWKDMAAAFVEAVRPTHCRPGSVAQGFTPCLERQDAQGFTPCREHRDAQGFTPCLESQDAQGFPPCRERRDTTT